MDLNRQFEEVHMRTRLTNDELKELRRATKPDLRDNLPGKNAQARAEQERLLGRDPTSWERGAEGERLVAAAVLAAPDWKVMHAVPIGRLGTDIDHLLIGASGVFTVNTKHLSKVIWYRHPVLRVGPVNRSEYLDKAVSESVTAAGVLRAACGWEVAVNPLIVSSSFRISSPRGMDTRTMPIPVMHMDQLVAWLRSLPEVLNTAQVEQLWERGAECDQWIRAAPASALDLDSPEVPF